MITGYDVRKLVKNSDVKEKVDAFIDQHRPKQIGEYTENGHVVRVFEPRYGQYYPEF